MTERAWLIENMISRAALTTVSGGHAPDVSLALAGSITKGYGIPSAAGWARDVSPHGHVLACGFDLEKLRDVDADTDRLHTLDLRDPEGNVRPFTVADVPTLGAELEQRRAALVVLADVETEALVELARVAEALNVALLVLCPDARRVPAGIAHSELQVVEIRDETYAVIHMASRLGPLGPAIAFSTWVGPSWDGLVDPAALEALPAVDASPAGTAPALAADAAGQRFVPLGNVDPAADFLRELLAHGPADAREVEQQGAARGLHIRTLRRRAAQLGVVHVKSGFQARAVWALPTAPTGTSEWRAPEGPSSVPHPAPQACDSGAEVPTDVSA